MARLKAEALVKRYRKRTVVDGASLEVKGGEIVGLLGPNGAGKTTCFYLIVGLIPPDAGRIELDGRDITHLPLHRRAQLGLGYLPQEASVFRRLSVIENLLGVLELRRDLSPGQRELQAVELLQEFGLSSVQDQLAVSLSGGERRRLEIARALALEPRFLLLDEPFAGVDPLSILDLKKIIRRLSEQGIGILITDHNVRETLEVVNRAYIIDKGLLIAEGEPWQVLENPQVRQVYLGDHFKMI
jgi:lipopolysaccharide export system ATP-binding protein